MVLGGRLAHRAAHPTYLLKNTPIPLLLPPPHTSHTHHLPTLGVTNADHM